MNNIVNPDGGQAAQSGQSSVLPGVVLGALGNNALFAATASNAGASDGQKRVKRFFLQSLARELLPRKRVAKCCRVRRASAVSLIYSPGVKKMHLGGLVTCGSPWDCPVCSAKIAVKRRAELDAGVKIWRERGGLLVMVTFTLRHHINDRVSVVVDALLAALRAMRADRAWKALKKRAGVVGHVRSLEVTWGQNAGFHPHCHEILFIEGGSHIAASVDEFQNELRAIWDRVLKLVGRDAAWEYGLKVDNADERIADYVAKWGHDPADETWTITKEVTMGLMKAARNGSMSMWQLLESYYAVSVTGRPDDWGHLFQDYSNAFEGKSQLQWSPGLRRLLFAVDLEKTDLELVEEQIEDGEIFAQLTPAQWDAVLSFDARADLVNLAEIARVTGDPALLMQLFDKIGIEGVHLALPPGASGDPDG